MINTCFLDPLMSIMPKSIEETLANIEGRVSQYFDEFLAVPFTKAKIKEALFQMNATKAPRPNRMRALFYQRY